MSEMLKNIDKKKIILIIIIIIVIITLLFGGSLLYYNLFNKKTYSDVENIMINATKEYLNNRKDELPSNNGDITKISTDKLIDANYMEPIEKYLKDENLSCDGTVNVTNINSEYRYVALLDCGESYSYKILSDYIKENEKTVTSNDGLYSINEELIYRGENVNNYVSFSDNIWRIVKITDNKIMLIYNDKLERTIWDDRYNSEKESNVGINDFKISRLKDYLTELYNKDTFLTKSDKLMLTSFDIPIGKRSTTDNDKSGKLEKSEVLSNQYIGLLSIYDYMNASTDNNCNSTSSLSCTNYNYLVDYDFNFWTPIADKNSSYYVYQISSYDGAYLTRASSSSYVRPVIILASDVIYKNGNGTIENPYTFK